MDRKRRQQYRRANELMEAVVREVDQEWENLARLLCGPDPVGSFPWALADASSSCNNNADDATKSSDSPFSAVRSASNSEATMEPASKSMRLEGGVTGETVREIAHQSVPPPSTVTSSAFLNATMKPGKPQVPVKTSLTVITTPMPSSKPVRPPLPPKPTVTLSITSKPSSKPEKPAFPSKPTITVSTTLKPTSNPGFATSQKTLSRSILPFTDTSSSSIQTAVLPNPPTTSFPSSSTLPPTKAVPESSLGSVVPSSIQTAILQVLGIVQQIHDTQKLQVQDSKRLEEKVDALASRMTNLEGQLQHFATRETSPGSERTSVVSVKIEKLSSIEELHQFDEKLGSDKEFFKAIVQWMESTIIAGDMQNRIRKALDLIFDRELVARTSENQQRLKVFFAKCINVHKLLQAIGRGNRHLSPTEEIVISQSIQKMFNESYSS